MTTLSNEQDAFGHAVRDYYHGKGGYEIIERSDGLFAISGGPRMYLSEYRDWGAHERAALEHAGGRVLDAGCNAGRHALHLQSLGHEVVGVDISPLSVEVARLRGLNDARVLPVTKLSAALGTVDTMLMLGNNFGLFRSAKTARWLLRRFRQFMPIGARIIAESLDVYRTDDPDHLDYLAHNRQRGRMSGQIRIRARYKRFVTPWFDYLMVSQPEMEAIVDGTGWAVMHYYDAEGARPVYAAIIERVA